MTVWTPPQMTLSRAELMASRCTDDEMVHVVLERLVGQGASEAAQALVGLGVEERRVLAKQERASVVSLCFVPTDVREVGVARRGRQGE